MDVIDLLKGFEGAIGWLTKDAPLDPRDGASFHVYPTRYQHNQMDDNNSHAVGSAVRPVGEVHTRDIPECMSDVTCRATGTENTQLDGFRESRSHSDDEREFNETRTLAATLADKKRRMKGKYATMCEQYAQRSTYGPRLNYKKTTSAQGSPSSASVSDDESEEIIFARAALTMIADQLEHQSTLSHSSSNSSSALFSSLLSDSTRTEYLPPLVTINTEHYSGGRKICRDHVDSLSDVDRACQERQEKLRRKVGGNLFIEVPSDEQENHSVDNSSFLDHAVSEPKDDNVRDGHELRAFGVDVDLNSDPEGSALDCRRQPQREPLKPKLMKQQVETGRLSTSLSETKNYEVITGEDNNHYSNGVANGDQSRYDDMHLFDEESFFDSVQVDAVSKSPVVGAGDCQNRKLNESARTWGSKEGNGSTVTEPYRAIEAAGEKESSHRIDSDSCQSSPRLFPRNAARGVWPRKHLQRISASLKCTDDQGNVGADSALSESFVGSYDLSVEIPGGFSKKPTISHKRSNDESLQGRPKSYPIPEGSKLFKDADTHQDSTPVSPCNGKGRGAFRYLDGPSSQTQRTAHNKADNGVTAMNATSHRADSSTKSMNPLIESSVQNVTSPHKDASTCIVVSPQTGTTRAGDHTKISTQNLALSLQDVSLRRPVASSRMDALSTEAVASPRTDASSKQPVSSPRAETRPPTLVLPRTDPSIRPVTSPRSETVISSQTETSIRPMTSPRTDSSTRTVISPRTDTSIRPVTSPRTHESKRIIVSARTDESTQPVASLRSETSTRNKRKLDPVIPTDLWDGEIESVRQSAVTGRSGFGAARDYNIPHESCSSEKQNVEEPATHGFLGNLDFLGLLSPTKAQPAGFRNDVVGRSQGSKPTQHPAVSLPQKVASEVDELIEVIHVEENFDQSDVFQHDQKTGMVFASRDVQSGTKLPWWKREEWVTPVADDSSETSEEVAIHLDTEEKSDDGPIDHPAVVFLGVVPPSNTKQATEQRTKSFHPRTAKTSPVAERKTNYQLTAVDKKFSPDRVDSKYDNIVAHFRGENGRPLHASRGLREHQSEGCRLPLVVETVCSSNSSSRSTSQSRCIGAEARVRPRDNPNRRDERSATSADVPVPARTSCGQVDSYLAPCRLSPKGKQQTSTCTTPQTQEDPYPSSHEGGQKPFSTTSPIENRGENYSTCVNQSSNDFQRSQDNTYNRRVLPSRETKAPEIANSSIGSQMIQYDRNGDTSIERTVEHRAQYMADKSSVLFFKPTINVFGGQSGVKDFAKLTAAFTGAVESSTVNEPPTQPKAVNPVQPLSKTLDEVRQQPTTVQSDRNKYNPQDDDYLAEEIRRLEDSERKLRRELVSIQKKFSQPQSTGSRQAMRTTKEDEISTLQSSRRHGLWDQPLDVTSFQHAEEVIDLSMVDEPVISSLMTKASPAHRQQEHPGPSYKLPYKAPKRNTFKKQNIFSSPFVKPRQTPSRALVSRETSSRVDTKRKTTKAAGNFPAYASIDTTRTSCGQQSFPGAPSDSSVTPAQTPFDSTEQVAAPTLNRANQAVKQHDMDSSQGAPTCPDILSHRVPDHMDPQVRKQTNSHLGAQPSLQADTATSPLFTKSSVEKSHEYRQSNNQDVRIPEFQSRQRGDIWSEVNLLTKHSSKTKIPSTGSGNARDREVAVIESLQSGMVLDSGARESRSPDMSCPSASSVSVRNCIEFNRQSTYSSETKNHSSDSRKNERRCGSSKVALSASTDVAFAEKSASRAAEERHIDDVKFQVSGSASSGICSETNSQGSHSSETKNPSSDSPTAPNSEVAPVERSQSGTAKESQAVEKAVWASHSAEPGSDVSRGSIGRVSGGICTDAARQRTDASEKKTSFFDSGQVKLSHDFEPSKSVTSACPDVAFLERSGIAEEFADDDTTAQASHSAELGFGATCNSGVSTKIVADTSYMARSHDRETREETLSEAVTLSADSSCLTMNSWSSSKCPDHNDSGHFTYTDKDNLLPGPPATHRRSNSSETAIAQPEYGDKDDLDEASSEGRMDFESFSGGDCLEGTGSSPTGETSEFQPSTPDTILEDIARTAQAVHGKRTLKDGLRNQLAVAREDSITGGASISDAEQVRQFTVSGESRIPSFSRSDSMDRPSNVKMEQNHEVIKNLGLSTTDTNESWTKRSLSQAKVGSAPKDQVVKVLRDKSNRATDRLQAEGGVTSDIESFSTGIANRNTEPRHPIEEVGGTTSGVEPEIQSLERCIDTGESWETRLSSTPFSDDYSSTSTSKKAFAAPSNQSDLISEKSTLSYSSSDSNWGYGAVTSSQRQNNYDSRRRAIGGKPPLLPKIEVTLSPKHADRGTEKREEEVEIEFFDGDSKFADGHETCPIGNSSTPSHEEHSSRSSLQSSWDDRDSSSIELEDSNDPDLSSRSSNGSRRKFLVEVPICPTDNSEGAKYSDASSGRLVDGSMRESCPCTESETAQKPNTSRTKSRRNRLTRGMYASDGSSATSSRCTGGDSMSKTSTAFEEASSQMGSDLTGEDSFPVSTSDESSYHSEQFPQFSISHSQRSSPSILDQLPAFSVRESGTTCSGDSSLSSLVSVASSQAEQILSIRKMLDREPPPCQDSRDSAPGEKNIEKDIGGSVLASETLYRKDLIKRASILRQGTNAATDCNRPKTVLTVKEAQDLVAKTRQRFVRFQNPLTSSPTKIASSSPMNVVSAAQQQLPKSSAAQLRLKLRSRAHQQHLKANGSGEVSGSSNLVSQVVGPSTQSITVEAKAENTLRNEKSVTKNESVHENSHRDDSMASSPRFQIATDMRKRLLKSYQTLGESPEMKQTATTNDTFQHKLKASRELRRKLILAGRRYTQS